MSKMANAGALAFLLGFGTGCGAAPEDHSETELASSEESIINGVSTNSNSNAVALYHRGTTTTGGCQYTNMWWPRPCSGILIRKDGNVNYVLTARHCVTVDGEINGPLITDPANLKATSAVQPGVLETNEWPNASPPVLETIGSPPSYTVNSTVHYSDTFWGDLAVVKATGNLNPTRAPERLGLLVFSPLERGPFVGMSLRGMGYGRITSGSCWGHANSGAGVLRLGSFYPVTNSRYTYFDHPATSTGNHTLTYGDSGGPLYAFGVTQNYTTFRIAGVNSTSSAGAGGEALIWFIQQALGYVFLVDNENAMGNSVVVGAELASGSIVRQAYNENSAKTRLKYVQYYERLTLNGLCLSDEGLNMPVRTRTCGGLQHKWQVKTNGQIYNSQSGRCLHRELNSTNLITTTCSNSTRLWTFVADNQVL